MKQFFKRVFARITRGFNELKPAELPVGASTPTVDARPMAERQDWELYASERHARKAEVEQYVAVYNKAFMNTIWISLAATSAVVFITFFSSVISVHAGRAMTWTVAHVQKLTSNSPKMNAAPALRELTPTFDGVDQLYSANEYGQRVFDAQKTLPGWTDVQPALKEQIALFKSGKQITDCDFVSKISQPWNGNGGGPKCRYSADQSRLWIWAFMRVDASTGYGSPLFTLIRSEPGKPQSAKIHFIQGMNFRPFDQQLGAGILTDGRVQKIGNAFGADQGEQLDLHLVPRALAADFPELKV